MLVSAKIPKYSSHLCFFAMRICSGEMEEIWDKNNVNLIHELGMKLHWVIK